MSNVYYSMNTVHINPGTEVNLYAAMNSVCESLHEIWGNKQTKITVFTFCWVVHEEALKQFMLNWDLLRRVIGKDVFMAHIVQT